MRKGKNNSRAKIEQVIQHEHLYTYKLLYMKVVAYTYALVPLAAENPM
jgi:hypothetical protein